MLKLLTKLVIKTGVVEKITKGNVILINCFHLEAPSIEDASYNSVFMLDKIPVASSIDVGKDVHALTKSQINFALMPASISRNPTALPPKSVM